MRIADVVTSLPASKIPPGKLYTEKYCPRGDMENRIKEQQLELFADRTSTYAKRYPLGQTFESNTNSLNACYTYSIDNKFPSRQ